MELLRHRPPPDADDLAAREDFIVAEGTPHPLIWAGEHLSPDQRQRFPLLDRLRLNSPAYDDERIWLSPQEAIAVLAELRLLRAVCRGATSVPGMNGADIWLRWHAIHDEGEFNEWLDSVERMLDRAGRESFTVLVSL